MYVWKNLIKKKKKVVCPNYIEQKNKKNEVISRKPCEYTCCSSCLRRYIEQSGSTARCMNCKNHLPREFLIQNLTKKWIEGKYKDHHSHLLYETEKAKCPEIMSFVEEYNNLDKLKEIQNDIKNTIRDLRTQLINNENKIKKLTFFDFTKEDKLKAKAKKFIRRCVKDGCKGFLSTNWNCGLCNSKVCKHCLEIKKDIDEKGNVIEHVCDEEKVKTVQLLNKDTKPCPSCGNMIMKISGCDQMWCPECKNAWSWKRGVVVHGYIHNPHFFEYQRKTKGRVDRAPGDVPCGANNVPNAWQWRDLINYLKNYKCLSTESISKLTNIYRIYGELNDIFIRPIETDIERLKDTTVLRVKYVLGKINDVEFENQIYKNNFNREKKKNYYTYTTFLEPF